MKPQGESGCVIQVLRAGEANPLTAGIPVCNEPVRILGINGNVLTVKIDPTGFPAPGVYTISDATTGRSESAVVRRR